MVRGELCLLVEHGGERGVMLAGVVCWYCVLVVEHGGERGVMLGGVVCAGGMWLLVDNIVVRGELCLLVLCAGIVCWCYMM